MRPVSADSGACSSHGGVNCGAGADYDGSVICNDSWRDSSVSFSSMSECQTKSTCDALLNAPGCSSEASYTNQQSYCTQSQTADIRSGRTNTSSIQQCADNLAKCRNEINQYQANLKLYDKCRQDETAAKYKNQQSNNQNNTSSQLNTELANGLNSICTNLWGVHSYYDYTSSKCACSAGYFIDTDLKCSATCSNNSSVKDGSCKCNEGSFWLNGKCLTYLLTPAAAIASSSSLKITAKSNTATSVIKIKYAYSEKNNLNIREKNSANSKIVGALKKKTNYKIIDSSDKTWMKINFNNKTGWVLKRSVSIK